MIKYKHLLLAFISLFVAVISLPLYADMSDSECSGTIATGCNGECGSSYFITHIVNRDDVAESDMKNRASFCLYTASNSLCPNTGAFFQLSKNGAVQSSGDLTEIDFSVLKARVGDEVSLHVRMIDKDDPAVCVTLGEIYYELGYKDK